METSGSRSRRARNAAETRALLIRVAREAFTEQGFAATTIDDLLDRAGVAKGALYHHFGSKEDVLRAVATEIRGELETAVIHAQDRGRDPWGKVSAGCDALLDACLDPDVQRVLLIDYPAVCGAADGAALATVIDHLRTGIGAAALVDGNPCRIPLEPLAYMLCGAIQEGAMRIVASDHPRRERRAVGETTSFLLGTDRAELLSC